MSEFAPDNASLAERLDSFFTVELPADAALAARYEADPQGTLAEHFADLPPELLADAMFHLGQNTTVTFAGAATTAPEQFEGESDFAYALRTSSDAGSEPGDLDAVSSGLEPTFAPDAGMDPFLDSNFDMPVGSVGGEFGVGVSSYYEADPSFEGAELEPLSVDVGADAGVGSTTEDSAAADDWAGDLGTDPGFDDDGEPLDPGLVG